jgi:predicted DNA binding CopG/RHH family protein
MDIDACIESIKACKYLSENDMRQLCNKVRGEGVKYKKYINM